MRDNINEKIENDKKEGDDDDKYEDVYDAISPPPGHQSHSECSDDQAHYCTAHSWSSKYSLVRTR